MDGVIACQRTLPENGVSNLESIPDPDSVDTGFFVCVGAEITEGNKRNSQREGDQEGPCFHEGKLHQEAAETQLILCCNPECRQEHPTVSAEAERG
jgi:hypothetical protein